MGKIEIKFAEKNFLQICQEYPKFKVGWEQMLTWIPLVDQTDWSDLKHFADGKYSGGSKKSKLILERVLEAFPDDGRRINGDHLIRQSYPKLEKGSFDEKIKKITEELQGVVSIIQNYLAYRELTDQKEKQKLLLKSLKRKNNYELFREAREKFNKLLGEAPLDLMQSHDQWFLHHLHYNHPGTGDTGYAAAIFMDTVYAFETFSQLTYLSYYLEALHLNIKLQTPEQLFIKIKAELILNHPGELPELVQLYILNIKMTLSHQLDEYAKFERLYEKHHQKLETSTHFNIVGSMSNIFYSLFNKTGDEKMAEEAFNWMMKAWHFRLYEHQGSINDGSYLNFMILACFFKQYELFTQFQQAHDHLLDPSIAKDLKAFCEARLHFEQSQYNQSLALLNEHFPLGLTTMDLKYGLRVKGLRVMIYFEMLYKHIPIEVFGNPPKNSKTEEQELDDLLINSMNALKQYCVRLKKLQFDEQVLIGNRRFIQIVGLFLEYLLAELRVDVTEKRQQLGAEIQVLMQESRPLAYRLWLGKMLTLIEA